MSGFSGIAPDVPPQMLFNSIALFFSSLVALKLKYIPAEMPGLCFSGSAQATESFFRIGEIMSTPPISSKEPKNPFIEALTVLVYVIAGYLGISAAVTVVAFLIFGTIFGCIFGCMLLVFITSGGWLPLL